jgi:hypothetical protein
MILQAIPTAYPRVVGALLDATRDRLPAPPNPYIVHHFAATSPT